MTDSSSHSRVLGLRPPGLKFRILCLGGSVISFSTSQEVVLAQFSLYVRTGAPHNIESLRVKGGGGNVLFS